MKTKRTPAAVAARDARWEAKWAASEAAEKRAEALQVASDAVVQAAKVWALGKHASAADQLSVAVARLIALEKK